MTSRTRGSLVGVFFLVGFPAASPVLAQSPSPTAAPSPETAPDSYPGVKAWMAGQAEESLSQLAKAPPSDVMQGEKDYFLPLDMAVVQEYMGRHDQALKAMETLELENAEGKRKGKPLVELPYWRGRISMARDAAKAPDVYAAFAEAEVDPLDWCEAGQYFLSKGDAKWALLFFKMATDQDEDSYFSWLGRGDAALALGDEAEAREDWAEAAQLYPGGQVLLRQAKLQIKAGKAAEAKPLLEKALRSLEGEDFAAEIRTLDPQITEAPRPRFHGLSATLKPGEKLVYRVHYMIFTVGTLTVENKGVTEHKGQKAQRILFTVKSNPFFSMLKINSKYESLVAEDGLQGLRQESLSDDSTQGKFAMVYDMDLKSRVCTLRGCESGLFDFARLPLPPMAQDGVSVFQFAREVARRKENLSVLTAVDDWKGTDLKTVGQETLKWQGRKIPCTVVEAFAHYQGPGGLSGKVTGWFSDDERAIPYKSKMKIAVGSVVFDLLPESVLNP